MQKCEGLGFVSFLTAVSGEECGGRAEREG